MSGAHAGRITRIITTEFPQYFAIVTRIKQEVHVIGAEGGILISSVADQVQAVFPPGALTKKIRVGLQVNEAIRRLVLPFPDIIYLHHHIAIQLDYCALNLLHKILK